MKGKAARPGACLDNTRLLATIGRLKLRAFKYVSYKYN